VSHVWVLSMTGGGMVAAAHLVGHETRPAQFAPDIALALRTESTDQGLVRRERRLSRERHTIRKHAPP